jgi:hypothetical protein
MLRVDADAFARGTLFWQGSEDAVDVDHALIAGDATPPVGRVRDVQLQWVRLWGPAHMKGITGPRGPGAGAGASIRFGRRPQPGQLEPADLVLDRNHFPGRGQMNVGADLARQGVTASP